MIFLPHSHTYALGLGQGRNAPVVLTCARGSTARDEILFPYYEQR
jgi:hypothetical protein